jgi:positive regulator of sigma E activity
MEVVMPDVRTILSVVLMIAVLAYLSIREYRKPIEKDKQNGR